MIIDSHAHLDFVDDLENALELAKNAGVGKIITIGTTLDESKRIIEIAQKYSDNKLAISTTAGIHPKDGKEDIEKFGIEDAVEKLRSIARSSSKIVAIGECGLNYYETADNGQLTTDKEKEFQRELFGAQIKLADDLGLPLVIHCRNGWDEIFNILKIPINYSSSDPALRESREVSSTGKFSINPDRIGINSNDKQSFSSNRLRGVFHSWTGNWAAAQKALDLGLYISFSGIVTFKNAPEIQEVAKKAPINRILIETDSPFLAPDPIRGQKNEPKNVIIVAQFLADLHGLPFAKIAEATKENAQRLFGI